MNRTHTRQPQFPLGQVVITPNALNTLSETDVRTALHRHVRGDWGDVCSEDAAANKSALRQGLRLLSVYHAADSTKFWIITEADRLSTCVLLPEDY